MDKEALEHYYGDRVRTLFVIAGLIMVFSYPFFRPLINEPLSLSIIGSLILAVFGGLMNPKQKWVIFLNTVIPVIAFMFFEYYAVISYIDLSPAEKTIRNIHGAFFWTNQILAIIFFLATYLSTKTLRGALLSGKD